MRPFVRSVVSYMSAKATWKISAAVMLSRVLGLVRDMVFNALFGLGTLMDSFIIAFRIPNLLRDLFAEGALSQAFVTTFSKRIQQSGPESAWPLAARMLTIIALGMSAISLVGIVFSPLLVDLMIAGGSTTFTPEDIALTVKLTRIMWPFMLLVSLAALVMGILNSRKIFGIPALSSCFFNLGSIIAGTGIGLWLDPNRGPMTMVGMAIGVLVGGLGQLVFQLPTLHRLGFRFRPNWDWKDSDVRKIFSLMAPAVISASVVQINVLINSRFATSIDAEGSVTALNNGFRLMQLPIGVFGVAVATVTLPAMSMAATTGIDGEFRKVLSRGIRLVAFLVLPCALGLYFLAEPVIAALFQRGKFGAYGTEMTAAALRGYGVGLLAYSGLKVLQPAFYAADRRWLPMIVSFFAIALSVSSNWYFVIVRGMGVEALAMTTSVVATFSFILLYFLMARIASGLETRALLVTLAKLAIAGLAMANICLLANHYWFTDPTGMGAWPRIGGLMIVIPLAAAVYLGFAKLLHVEEVDEFLELVRRRVAKK